MGTGRKFNKQPVTRPKKSPLERKRREASQRKRLVELGLDAEEVRKMDSKTIRALIQKPEKVKASVEA
ncbi:MAG: hypothetical protein QGH42_13495 [Kiritimatiellia bacterium]|jgi:hypothetical protein|nr:hypothetical protein [Dehalococcoidia bacterium]MDP6629983.1 hypothetical protein [Kiritimatiellia bacterium]MDP7025239.1 hypothetical protein [Kiritimatiellia bacterium]